MLLTVFSDWLKQDREERASSHITPRACITLNQCVCTEKKSCFAPKGYIAIKNIHLLCFHVLSSVARYGLIRAPFPRRIPRPQRRWRWGGVGGGVLLELFWRQGRGGRQQLVCREQRLRLAS